MLLENTHLHTHGDMSGVPISGANYSDLVIAYGNYYMNIMLHDYIVLYVTNVTIAA